MRRLLSLLVLVGALALPAHAAAGGPCLPFYGSSGSACITAESITENGAVPRGHLSFLSVPIGSRLYDLVGHIWDETCGCYANGTVNGVLQAISLFAANFSWNGNTYNLGANYTYGDSGLLDHSACFYLVHGRYYHMRGSWIDDVEDTDVTFDSLADYGLHYSKSAICNS